ncbi:hypothetical protein ACFV8T_39780 [Streptomyces sp. NPDC059832]
MERQTAALRELSRRAFLEPDVVADDAPGPECTGTAGVVPPLERAV